MMNNVERIAKIYKLYLKLRLLVYVIIVMQEYLSKEFTKEGADNVEKLMDERKKLIIFNCTIYR